MRVVVQGRLKQRSYETREGEKRTVFELDVEEVGPSLKYATAKVTRTRAPAVAAGSPAAAGAQGGGQGGDDPWSTPAPQQSAPQGGQQYGGQQGGGNAGPQRPLGCAGRLLGGAPLLILPVFGPVAPRPSTSGAPPHHPSSAPPFRRTPGFQKGSTTMAKAVIRKPKKKVCQFCKEKATGVDYKDTTLLRKFISDRGKIRARRVTGNCVQHQRDVAIAVKNAREVALLPYTSTGR